MYGTGSCHLLQMVGLVSRQDQSNPLIIFLAPGVGKTAWFCVLGISVFVLLGKILFCLEITSLPRYYFIVKKV